MAKKKAVKTVRKSSSSHARPQETTMFYYRVALFLFLGFLVVLTMCVLSIYRSLPQ